MQTKLTTPVAPRLISLCDAADVLGVSTSTVKNLVDRGELTKIKILRRALIDMRDIDALIEKQKGSIHDN